MGISQIIEELKEMLPESNFHVQPVTSKKKLIDLERNYDMTTYEFVNMKKDISIISEDKRLEWLDTLETYCNFGGVIEGIND